MNRINSDSEKEEAQEETGIVFNIQRFSTEDGPGIRTTVFVKGCPLRCIWCHNPEGISFNPELVWYDVRCIGARDCLRACPKDALVLTPEGMAIKRDSCDCCGLCEEACPAAAIEVVGKEYTVEEVLDVVERDKVFYETSGGGVTIGGGEPAAQYEFSVDLMVRCRDKGIHSAVDTCGHVSEDKIGGLVEAADLVLYDIKLMNEERHRELTGVGVKRILDSARMISEMGKPMWIRTPIIPGCTDSSENIREISRFIAKDLTTVERYDLLAFNNTCVPKYRRLDREFPLKDAELVTKEVMETLAEVARREGVGKVVWSGATKVEKHSGH